MNDTKAAIIDALGGFAEDFDIDGIDMELFNLDLTVESDEFWAIVSQFDLVSA